MELAEAIFSIVLINVVLSGDNAVVIGMAAHRLPGHQRRWAISVGTIAAIVIRVILTAVASMLLAIPFLKLAGGALLLWIAFQLLKDEELEHEGTIVPETLRAAIQTIIVADIVMSTDNVLGIAAAARGNNMLLVLGLLLSMPIIMIGGGLIASILDRFWWLAYVGSAVIAWTSIELMLSDPLAGHVLAAAGLVFEHLNAAGEEVYDPTIFGYTVMVALMAFTLSAAHYVHRYRPARVKGGRQADE
jgi:YjbE family integral membrane protein